MNVKPSLTVNKIRKAGVIQLKWVSPALYFIVVNMIVGNILNNGGDMRI